MTSNLQNTVHNYDFSVQILADDMDHPCVRDAEFVLEYINKNVEFVIKSNINPAIMNQKLPPDPFFRGEFFNLNWQHMYIYKIL